MANRDNREPYHFMDTSIRITTAATIRTRSGSQLVDLLTIEEEVGGDARHATNELSLWLGNQSDPASVVTVCDRLIAALTEIRQRNADLAAIDAESPAQGHEVVAEWTRPEGATS